MKVNMSTNGTSTISDFINTYKSEILRPEVLGLREVIPSIYDSSRYIIMMSSYFITKYKSEIQNSKTLLKLSETDYNKYRFNPKLLSYDIYGTTELASLIKYANEIYTDKEFNLREVYVYNISALNKVIRMIDLENTSLTDNTEEIRIATS